MSLTKEIVVDQISVNEFGVVAYREATRIVENENILAQSFHRSSVSPGDDISSVPATVASVCNAVWTPEVIAAFQEKVANAINRSEAMDQQPSV